MAKPKNAGKSMLATGMILAAVLWIIDSLVNVYVFGQGYLTGQIVSPTSKELWTRLLFVGSLAAFAMHANFGIVKLKRSKEELRQGRSFLENILDGIDPLTVLDSNLNIVVANRAARTLSIGNDSLVGKKCFEVFQSRKEPCDSCPVVEVFHDGMHHTGVINISTSDGPAKWFEISAFPLRDSSGSPIEVVTCVREVTERKLSEDSVRKSREELDMIINSLPALVSAIDTEQRFFYVNKAVETWFNQPAAELKGRHLSDVLGEPAYQSIRRDVEAALQGSRTENDFFLQNSTGSPGYFHGIYNPQPANSGKTGGILALFSDTTNRRLAEKESAQNKHLLETIMEGMPEGLIALDSGKRIVLMSATAKEIIGCPQKEVLGRTPAELADMLDRETGRQFTSFTETLSGQMTYNQSRIFTRRNGADRLMSVSGSCFRDNQGKCSGFIMLLRDVTEQQRRDEAEMKAEKLESIGILAGGIAHDFNNILTAILGNITLAKMYARPSSKTGERLKDAEKAALQAKDLTQQLLTFSKGGAPIKKTIQLSELLRASASFAMRGSGSRCHIEIARDLLPVDADESQLLQVFNNLIVNADQAMPEGGTISVEAGNASIEMNSHLPLKPGKYVKVSIRDKGIGILKEHLHKVFDPYFSTKQKGSGLGLTAAYSIVKNHSGHIEIESEVGVGTTVSFYLPATEENPQEN